MKTKLNVDKDIIRCAVRKSTCECLAARELFRQGFRRIKVNKNAITANKDGQSVICSVPPKLASIIENFDSGKQTRPFSVMLNFSTIHTDKKKKSVKNIINEVQKRKLKKRGPKKGISQWSNYRYQGVMQLANNKE